MVTVDYTAFRMCGEEHVHHDVTAWLGPKFQGVLHLSSDEFRQELRSHGPGSTFVIYKEKPCSPVVVAATLGLPLQTEVY